MDATNLKLGRLVKGRGRIIIDSRSPITARALKLCHGSDWQTTCRLQHLYNIHFFNFLQLLERSKTGSSFHGSWQCTMHHSGAVPRALGPISETAAYCGPPIQESVYSRSLGKYTPLDATSGCHHRGLGSTRICCHSRN